MNTWHLHIEGLVQGVGFRPFVYQLAEAFDLRGWVNNTVDGVHVVFNADAATADAFTQAVLSQAPPLARITNNELRPTQRQTFDDFKIVHSETEGVVNLMLAPDFAICSECRNELRAAGNRRKDYPFTTCTQCGPRFSIARSLPYDRATTAMDAFQMCPTCKSEYLAPTDRRYFSQTNSCPDCAVKLSLINSDLQVISTDPALIIDRIVQLWEAGYIVGIKGIGGYLLTCDAGNTATIKKLRNRKHRPDKPFALMYPSLESIRRDVALNEVAIQELSSSRSPIVLLPWKNTGAAAERLSIIAPGLSRIGLMLPYTPLYELLLTAFGRPIVATSGNLSHAPIVFEDEKARKELIPIADYLLCNNRDIVVPQDDSVVQYSPFYQRKVILRRSRGMAPSYFADAPVEPSGKVLAMGAMLKSTFALTLQGNTFVSQYLGDLQHYGTEQSYRYCLEHFLRLFDILPECLMLDKHQDYASARMGWELAQKYQIPVISVQHHSAHFAAVLGENNLLRPPYPVLGVIWDGTGLGDDRQIWGGEFLLYQNYRFVRWGCFSYFDVLAGDKMAREPRISALSLCWEMENALPFIRSKFTEIEWKNYQKILTEEKKKQIHQPGTQTSSVGRIFDGVASLLGLVDRQTYEGEAAIRLEQLATAYFQREGLDFTQSYWCPGIVNTRQVPTKVLIAGILDDLQSGKSSAFIAAKFHFSLVDIIKQVSLETKLWNIAFSGGVFQNGLLVDLLVHHLKADDYHLFFHRDLSPNDENIAYGQLVYHQIQKIQAKITDQNFKQICA